MAHHRCSRCRHEVGIRHKRSGYLFCEECLRRQSWESRPRRSIFDFIGRAWRWLREATINLFGQPAPAVARKTFNAKTRATMASAQFKARNVPVNPMTVMPQKR